jgi:hypothetical protein
VTTVATAVGETDGVHPGIGPGVISPGKMTIVQIGAGAVPYGRGVGTGDGVRVGRGPVNAFP